MTCDNNDLICTTVNVRGDLYDLIDVYSERWGLDIEEIIKIFLERMTRQLLREKSFKKTAMQYQAMYSVWEKPHVTFTQSEFDRFLDVKKVYRLSLSLILAMALEKFTDYIIAEALVYSYPEYRYYKAFIEYQNDILFVFGWKETNKTKKLAPE